MFGDIQINTANETINDLFVTGGMAGMLHTVWLILSAMVFGGIMEAGGMLKLGMHRGENRQARTDKYCLVILQNPRSGKSNHLYWCVFRHPSRFLHKSQQLITK